MDLISIIVPIYRVEQFLPRCLDAILDQTYTHWEAVCVNDGSPDGSQAILEEYAARDPRFRIVLRENGGLSDARNAGVASASGEWVIFLDSDDFIHPQTLEVALALARRVDAELVTYYKDPLYRTGVRLRHALALQTNSYTPWRSLKKRFRAARVRYHVTDCMAEHLTEVNDRGIKHQIRHFYAWRYLLKRSLAERVPFIKGLIFEDFPWVSELLLQRPRTVITQLPFYFYHPNTTSILGSAKRSSMLINWVKGIDHLLPLFHAQATPHERECWVNQCLWPVVSYRIFRHFNDESVDDETRELIVQHFTRFVKEGWFDNPPGKEHARVQQMILRLMQDREVEYAS